MTRVTRSIYRSSLYPTVVLAAASVLVLSGAAVAAEQPLAEVENQGDTLVFHPVTQFAELLLTVTGPCDFQYRQRVDEGEPFFRLDETTIDGAYTYDLVRIEEVDPGIVKILMQARKLNDEETPRALCRDGKLPGPAVSQSEGFLVSRGKIIYDPRLGEKSLNGEDKEDGGLLFTPASGNATALATKDFVILDDLIVDGSACIGFDCVNGESFGFDTIRLKENNLRIKFDDTSVAASFPRNDWQLTANESANGGASKFSIEDISGGRTPFTVEANARSHSLYVDDGGRIGSRTSTPSVEIHTIDGDTPTLRLQQDGSSGFAPQTWDVAGNETNFFIRDVTNGSALPLRIRPGAPTSAIDVASSGDVGIGTASPDEAVHVLRSDANPTELLLENTNGTAQTVGLNFVNGAANAAAGWSFRVGGNGDFVIREPGGTIHLTIDAVTEDWEIAGDVTANGMLLTSSREAKEGLTPIDNMEILAKVAGLPITEWSFRGDEAGARHVGPMAEDFHNAFALKGQASDTLSMTDVNGITLAAIQGLNQLVAEKELELQRLSDQNAELLQRLSRLEALVSGAE